MEIQLHCDIKILSCTNESWDLLSSSPRGSILTNAMIGHTSFIRWAIPVYVCLKIVYRITTILKVETDIIANISANLIGRTGIFVIMSVEAFKTDIIVFIGDVIMCFTSDWQINLGMQVTNWPSIFVDQGHFSDPDFISGTHQRKNVQFVDNILYWPYLLSQYILPWISIPVLTSALLAL